jgi:uncharacterized membrane protein YqaE (UPF0057 family)
MLYFLAIILPPVAVLLVGKPIQALLNLVLCLFFYIPGVIHAILVVKDQKDDKRMRKQAELIAQATKHNENSN